MPDNQRFHDEEENLSPSERMAHFKQNMEIESRGLAAFWETLPFSPDRFQVDALEALALGSSVLVCAPTGAGKTVVGEGAVYLALENGERAFYTTPIKALSNQKYREFCDTFGSDRVGLLTGDAAVNSHADVVVMTTEVLRNMIYAGANLSELGIVVLDEIHYLADRIRGPVWEEVLIQLPQHIRVVALSATVSNSAEFGKWIGEVRGSCVVINSRHRPVPLYQHMMVGRKLFDLYAAAEEDTEIGAGRPGLINPDLLRAVSEEESRGGRNRPGRRRIPGRISRPRILSTLERRDLLPVIEFIFSRAGCEAAVEELLASDMTLTTNEERRLIRAATEEALRLIPIADHGVLGLARWQTGLERGIAAHHAGMLPILKETVETLFAAGLVKVVFATETLALGINMPARTVVLESLEKWNGSEHVRLSSGEYTQLTGRAGRRGIDVEGHAVVLARGVVSPEELAQMSSRHNYPLKSAFVPSYNMVVNLLHHSTIARVRQVLESSFAQFQADDSVVGLAARLRKAERSLEEASEGVECSKGDAEEYFSLREELARAQKKYSQKSRTGDSEATARALARLKFGQVIRYRRGRRWYSAAVLGAPDAGWRQPNVRVLGEDARIFTLGPTEINRGPEVIGHVRLPRGGVRRLRDRQGLAKQLRSVAKRNPHREKQSTDPELARLKATIAELEARIAAHPVHSCPHRDQHAALGHGWVRAKRECDRLASQINARTSSIANEFDRVTAVLTELGFLAEGSVTAKGQQLRRVFGERDLLVAQCLAAGHFSGLEPEEFAALASALVYEPRGDVSIASADFRLPTKNLNRAWEGVWGEYQKIHATELRAGTERTPTPAPNLAETTYRWAQGATLAAILGGESELTGGDFVRWTRQAIDLLEQLTRLSGETERQARAAIKKIRRGVVAWVED